MFLLLLYEAFNERIINKKKVVSFREEMCFRVKTVRFVTSYDSYTGVMI